MKHHIVHISGKVIEASLLHIHFPPVQSREVHCLERYMGKSWGVAAGACAIAFVTWRAACMCTCNFNGRLQSQQKPRSGKTNRKTDFFFLKERQKCEDANSLIRKHCCLFCFEAIVLNNIYLISINYCMLVTCICSGPVM